MDPDNEDDVVESSCIDYQDVFSRTRKRLGLDPDPAVKPHWLDR